MNDYCNQFRSVSVSDEFVMFVEDSFNITNRGTAIVGNYKGKIRIGDRISDFFGNTIEVTGMDFPRSSSSRPNDDLTTLLYSSPKYEKGYFNNRHLFSEKDFTFLFCSDPFNKNEPDIDYVEEYNAAKKLGFESKLFNFDDFVFDGSLKIKSADKPTAVIYRGWMMTVEQYADFHRKMIHLNYYLVNSPAQYRSCHHLPEWYDQISDLTPKSVWAPAFETTTLDLLSALKGRPLIVKDYVKSRKHEWFDACYIPNSNDLEQALTVIENFVNRQGEHLVGGVVLREYVALQESGHHPKSGIPLHTEFRLFVMDGRILSCISYWQGERINEIPEEFMVIVEKTNKIGSPFYTVDIAKTVDNHYILIEVCDGQVSGLQDLPAEEFYASFRQMFVV